MNFSNPYSRDLGVFTWAELQAAYPNGGGALSALPSNAMAWVSDYLAWFRPNAAKTLWSVAQVTPIVLDATSQTGSTSGANQVVKQAALPAAILRAGRKFVVKYAIGKNGTTDATDATEIRLGTAGTTGDTLLRSASTITAGQRSMGVWQEFVVTTATNVNWHGPMNYAGWGSGGSASVNPTSTTVADLDANAVYLSVCIDIGGTTNAPQVFSLEVELHP